MVERYLLCVMKHFNLGVCLCQRLVSCRLSFYAPLHVLLTYLLNFHFYVFMFFFVLTIRRLLRCSYLRSAQIRNLSRNMTFLCFFLFHHTHTHTNIHWETYAYTYIYTCINTHLYMYIMRGQCFLISCGSINFYSWQPFVIMGVLSIIFHVV